MCKEPVINSSRGGGKIYLGGTNILHAQREGVKNNELFTRGNMEFLLTSWRGYHDAYINLRGGRKFHQVFENVFHPLPTSI